MSDQSSGNRPELPPTPGSAQGARAGRVSGRVVTVLGISLALAVVGMLVGWYAW
jgi:hypothetical protein